MARVISRQFLQSKQLFQLGYRRSYHAVTAVAHQINLEKLIGKESVISEDLDNYTMDWTQHYQGGSLVCLPSSSIDVSKVFEYCYRNHIAMVPQGGNTGLVRELLL
jgi:hypothetical protein